MQLSEKQAVAYAWEAIRGRREPLSIDEQFLKAASYAKQHNFKLLAKFQERIDVKKGKLTQFAKALELCKKNNALLIIPALSNLLSNAEFATQLQESNINFICLDNQAVNKDSLTAIIAYTQHLHKTHSQSIKEGLSKTDAALGNPRALELITSINQTKVAKAVLFALVLQPIVNEYEAEGLSQRKIVDLLNQEGYTAPEGGNWVLSQYQKVLARIKTNELALNIRPILEEMRQQGASDEEIVAKLNAGLIKPHGEQNWDVKVLNKVRKRLQTIVHVVKLCKVIEENHALLSDFINQGLSKEEIADELNKRGVPYPEKGDEL